MTQNPVIRIADVAYDAASRRYFGAVTVKGAARARRLQVSAPGCPGWTHRQITAALCTAGRKLAATTGDVHAYS